MMAAVKKAFDLMVDAMVELATESESLKSKIGCYDENWLEESKAEMLKHNDDER